jgi:protein MpaA
MRRIDCIWLILMCITFGCESIPTETTVRPPAKKTMAPAPVMETTTLGQSVEGRPIVMHRFGTGDVGTLIIGGIHGDETTAYKLAERFVDLLRQGGELGTDGAVAIIPIANPDAAVMGRRTNARRVDINRNFPAANWSTTRKGVYHGGSSALSEPETRAIHVAVESLKPKRIVSIHSIGRGRECNNYDGPGESLAQRMAAQNGYPVRATIGYPTPGSFGSWAGTDLKIAVVTLELPRDLPADRAWETNRGALLQAIRR